MKLYAPKYYKKFACIADKCEHSCCIGWEIDVDESALEKYKAISGGYGSVIADSISEEGTPHFRLMAHDRCPHLDERGLCRIIVNLGEDYLCDICRQHPRFYNYTKIAEVGIGMSCPEAARIVLSSPEYDMFEHIGEVSAVSDSIDFDGSADRSRIYEILQDRSVDYISRLNNICREYSVDLGDDHQWLNILDSLEYLDESHRQLFMKYSSTPCSDVNGCKDSNEYLERFFAYLIYRHCTEAFDHDDLRSRLTFCLFCERLLASLICAEGVRSLKDIAQLASIISEEIEYSDDNTLALTY